MLKGDPWYKSMLRSKTVVLTGVGASVPLGMPAMRGFFDTFDSKQKGEVERFVGWSGDSKLDLEFLLARLEWWRQLREARGQDRAFASVVKPQEFNQMAGSADALREVVFRKIIDLYGELSPEAQQKASSLYLDMYSKLCEKALNRPAVLPIFTTNYDCTFEAISEVNDSFEICTGMRQRRGFSLWDPNIYKECEYKFAIFRLHGCSYWVKHKPTGQIRYQFPDRDNMDIREPCILYPEPGKDSRINEEPFGTAYEHFRRCLLEAKLVVVIGYSGRDDAVQSAFKETVFADPEKKFILVSKGKADTKSLQSVIGKDKILAHFDSGIEEAAPKLINELDTIAGGC